MRGGQVWSQKTPLDGNDSASKAPTTESASSDGLDGVAPIESGPAVVPAAGPSKKLDKPASPAPDPAAVDDFFQQRPQGWLIDLRPDWWEDDIPARKTPLPPGKAECVVGAPAAVRQEKQHSLGAVVLGGLFLLTPVPCQPFQRQLPTSSPFRPRLGRPVS